MSSKYELELERDTIASFINEAVDITLRTDIPEGDENQRYAALLSLNYHFELEEYQAILAKRALGKLVSEAGL